MPPKAPRTIDELVRDYAPLIRSFINGKNKDNSTQLDADEFEQKIYIKCNKTNIFEKYDPEKASFNTYFRRILLNYYYNEVRKQENEDKKIIKVLDDQTFEDKPDDDPVYIFNKDFSIEISEDLAELLLQWIDEIPDMKARLSIKVKLYPLIRFTADEMLFMAENAGVAPDTIEELLTKMHNEKPGQSPGLRDVDAAKLLGYRSFTTQRDRAVRKHLIPRYTLYREGNQ